MTTQPEGSEKSPARPGGHDRRGASVVSLSGPVEPRLGRRGGRLWASLSDRVVGDAGLVLLEEACRIADRLDRLDALLTGDADVWCRLVEGRDDVLELRVDGALVEARQQANTLRQLVGSLPLEGVADDDDADGWVAELSS